jgi:hypothetical protein
MYCLHKQTERKDRMYLRIYLSFSTSSMYRRWIERTDKQTMTIIMSRGCNRLYILSKRSIIQIILKFKFINQIDHIFLFAP